MGNQEAQREIERQKALDFARQEELRKEQTAQLEALRVKAVSQQQRASAKVELKQYSSSSVRPGNVEHFGYGNVVTGQVASRKYEILTSRASSVGRFEEREGLNPD